MPRRVFFSFHYERDAWRAGQVRNSWVTQDRQSAGFWDAAAWEEVKRKGDAAIKRWIDNQLSGTSVTVVLIGAETSQRQYIQYEISESHVRGNGLLGIYIHNLKNVSSMTDIKGANPLTILDSGRSVAASILYPLYQTYDWVYDNGRQNMGRWIEEAAQRAGR